ncbi:MAG: MarR family winged helix-turn-helix transcriptional regulator [Rubrivivax sp.]
MRQKSPSRDATTELPRGCTNLQLRQLTRQVTQHYDARMAAAGLKTTQYSLLSTVLRLGPARPADLAAMLKMDPSTLTRNLKPLITAGWVEMAAGADARSRAVSITAAGRAKRTEAQRHWKSAQDSLNQALGVPRVLALHTLIQESLTLLADEADLGDD